jgi:protein TonB
LKFSNYILLSLLFHLLFFGIMGMLYPGVPAREEVFNVDIVDVSPLKPPDIESPKPVLKKRWPSKIRRRPPAKDLPPDTILDKETGGHDPDAPLTQEGVNGPLARKEEGGSLPERGLEKAEPGDGTGRFSLFDSEVIRKYARKLPKPEKGITFDATEFKHRGYMRRLREQIEQIWEYPHDAIREKLSGDLYIMFTIKRNGELGEVEVVRTSGYISLDRAAVKALQDASPFWPLPDDWPEDVLEIKGHFIYIYGRTYVM